MRTKITLACTECKNRNYNTTKDKKAHPATEWKPRSIVDSARLIHYTRKPNRLLGKGVRKWEKTENKAAQKESFFSGLSAEFKKIIWPDNKSLARQTAAVVAVSVVMGLVIALLDFVIQYGVDFLVGLSF